MSSKVWSIGIQKHTKMIQHHVYIRSTDQFNQVGVHEKNDRNEMNSVYDHRVWLCIRVTIFSNLDRKSFWITCWLNCAHWIWSFVSSFSLVVWCGSTFATALPNIPQSFLMATFQQLRVFVCWGKTVLLNNPGRITTVPACSSGTLTNVLPH